MSRTPYAAFKLAPEIRKTFLMNTFCDQLGFGAISQVAQQISAEAKLKQIASNQSLTNTLDIANAATFGAKNDEEDDCFREASGNALAAASLDPMPESVMGMHKYVFARICGTKNAEKYPPRNIGGLLMLLKESPEKAKAISDAVAGEAEGDESGLVMQSQIAAGVTRRKAQQAAFDDERALNLHARVMDMFDCSAPVSAGAGWDDLPAWFRYKCLIALLKNASRAVGSLKAEAERNATNAASTAKIDHSMMVECAKELQEQLDRLLGDETDAGQVAAAFDAKKLDGERHAYQ